MTTPTDVNRKYTWMPEVPDPRDRLSRAPVGAAGLPSRVDRILRNMPVENQGALGSCVGHAVTSVFEHTTSLSDRSRLFVYYNARTYIGMETVDSGCYIRDAIKSLVKFGVCRESQWPYVLRWFSHRPPSWAYSSAFPFRTMVKEYRRVLNLQELKANLALGQPVMFGFVVPESFNTRTPYTGLLALPQSGENILGGHAVVADGYDDTLDGGVVWVRNSYGKEWGINGWYKMPYAWFTDERRLVDDMWAMLKK